MSNGEIKTEKTVIIPEGVFAITIHVDQCPHAKIERINREGNILYVYIKPGKPFFMPG